MYDRKDDRIDVEPLLQAVAEHAGYWHVLQVEPWDVEEAMASLPADASWLRVRTSDRHGRDAASVLISTMRVPGFRSTRATAQAALAEAGLWLTLRSHAEVNVCPAWRALLAVRPAQEPQQACEAEGAV